MNIFYLDTNIAECARAACDKHIVKMITEHAQLLSGALIELGFEAPYKMTHRNHPCAKWVRESYYNFRYLYDLTYYYNVEYQRRYGPKKTHGAWEVINQAIHSISIGAIYDRFIEVFGQVGPSAPPCAMPDHYKVYSETDEGLVQTAADVVQSYRNYYIGDKLRFVTYKNAPPPEWIREALQNTNNENE